MKYILLVLLTVGQFCFIQCNSSQKDQNSKTQDGNKYFPLRNNLKWQYINEAPRDDTLLIDVNCIINNNKKMFDKFPFLGNTDSETELYFDRSYNLMVKDKAGNSLLLLPPESKFADGYKWKYSDLLTAYMTKTPVEVKTEAGTFSCIYVVFTDGFTFSYEIWLTEGVGIVKWGANRTNPPAIPVYYVLKEHNG